MLGYDVAPGGGSLVVNSSEARRVAEIFELYRIHRSLAAVVAELAKRGRTTKSWKSRRGQRHTGRPFTKASVRMLLSNATYCGRVNYRGVVYQGEHKAIIEPALWDDINKDFSERSNQQPELPNVPQNAPLSGLLICQHCQQPMIATYSAKKRRYRYYICQTAREKGWKSCPTKSVSADLLEASIVIQLRSQFSGVESRQTFEISDSYWQALVLADAEVIPGIIQALIENIDYDGLRGAVGVKLRTPEGFPDDVASTFEYKIPRRRGRALPAFRLRPASETLTRPPRLSRLLALAHKLEGVVRSGKVKDYAELARLAHISSARIGQIVMLGLLAPAIQEHVLFLPAEQAGLIVERELRDIAREPRWDRQRARFDELLAARH